MRRGALLVLRLIILALWGAVMVVMSVPFPSSGRGVNANVYHCLAWWMLFCSAVCATQAGPVVGQRLAAVWRAPLTVWEVLVWLFLTAQVVFIVWLAVASEAEDYGFSTFDAALEAFVDGSSGLQPLMDAQMTRATRPKRPWTLSRVAAAVDSLRDGSSDPSKVLHRLSQQFRVMRDVSRAIKAGPAGAEDVDEEAVRQNLRAYLATHSAEGVGGGGRHAMGSREGGAGRGVGDEHEPLLPPPADHDAIGRSAA